MTLQLPDYAAVSPASLEAACAAAVAECDAVVAGVLAVPDGPRTFANTVAALEEARHAVDGARLAWTVLGQVSPDAAVRGAARDGQTRLLRRLNDLDSDERVHAAVRAYAGGAEAAGLGGEDARLLRDVVADQRRQGADLPAEQRSRLRELFAEVLGLCTDFRAALVDWSDGIVVTRGELDGLPDAFVAGLARVGDGYRVSLDYPEFNPFLAHARSAARRRELLEKDRRKGGPENLARLDRILTVRAEIAALLGHASWAAYVTGPRMAGSPEAVAAFLEGLWAETAPKAAADRAELAAYCDESGAGGDIAPWDEAFAIARLKEAKYAVDELEFAEYCPLDAVLEGLLGVTGELLGLRYEPVPDAPVWHPDVRVYDVYEAQEAGGGKAFARIVMDLFPRPGKYKHAMSTTLRMARRLPDGSWQPPVNAIVANLTKPAQGRPALLRHRELVTLFHEFGHALHASLSRAEHGRYAGETEFDFSEAPSQMLEHWVWEAAVLRRFARHHVTGEPLPDALLAGMLAARNAASGVMTSQALMRSALDQAFHGAEFGTRFGGDSAAAARELSARYGVPYAEGTHFPSGWLHMAGAYGGGYYSYLWSRVLGDDLFTRFAEAGPLDPATGARYRRTVLEPGGTVDAADMVRAFLGREPDNAAYLRGIGVRG